MRTRLTKANLQDSVTQHMRTDFTRLHLDHTVGEALTSVRERQGEGRIIYFYVVDGDGRLKGVVPTRRLLLNPPDKPVAEIMVERVIAIPAAATVLDACEFFILHQLLAARHHLLIRPRLVEIRLALLRFVLSQSRLSHRGATRRLTLLTP